MSDDVMRSLGRIEGKQDLMLIAIQNQSRRIDEQDRKIQSLTVKIYTMSGAAAVVGFVVAQTVNFKNIF